VLTIRDGLLASDARTGEEIVHVHA
jgi:hypothetical protein